MEAIFIWLSDAMTGARWIALLAAAGWGVASLVLSPCHLASIPLIVGFIAERKDTSTRQAFFHSLLFALGILLSIAAVGGITAAAGRMLGDVGPWANYAVAAVLVLVGLHLMSLLPLPWKQGLSLPRFQGKSAALLLGLIFGIALGPCTFAYLAPVLGVIFSVARTQPGFAAALILAFGIGHCLLIVIAGTSTAKVQKIQHWHKDSTWGLWLRFACGLLVLGGAVWLVVTAQ
jgi:cytochrome c-type biogenesis protein